MNLVLVEDSVLIRTQLSTLLNHVPGLNIVAMAGSEAEAIAMIDFHRPDLVVLDLSLSPGNGFSVLKDLRRKENACCVLMLSNHHYDSYRELSRKWGADAFYDKSTEIDQLIEHVRRIAINRRPGVAMTPAA